MRPGYRELARQAELQGRSGVPFNPHSLPIKEIAAALVDRADELGLVWRLVPATVAEPGDGGLLRVVLDGDSVAIDAVTMIGRVPVGARVFTLLTPPAGTHIVGFLGYDFPATVPGEQVGRSWLYVHPADTTLPNNTTYINIPGFAIPILARAQYVARLRLAYDAPLTSDVKVRWQGPADCAMDRNVLGIPNTATGSNIAATELQSIRRSIASDALGGTFNGSANAFTVLWEDILITAGATAGTLQLQAAVNAANGAGVIQDRSTLEVQRYR